MQLIKLTALSMVYVLISCSTKTNIDKQLDTFKVYNPIIKDTIYNNEYVADLHAVQYVEIRARVKGFIEVIHIDEGSKVKAGQTIITLSSRFYQEEVLKANASLKSAIAEAKAFELELQNTQKLVDNNVVSKSEFELAKSRLDAANARIEQAKADEANARLNLSYTEIKAPFDGTINRLPNKKGSLIDEGTLITSISNSNELFAYFNVSEREYLQIMLEKNEDRIKEVSLVLANNEIYKHKGIIETTEGEFDKSTGNIAFRARFQNPDNILKHGATGKILLSKKIKNAIIIPQKSSFDIQDKSYVFIVDETNTVRAKGIQVRYRLQQVYLLENGLSATDRIIYEGIQLVKEGDIISTELIANPIIKLTTSNL
jgi:RND family efflux transporter MFP subunit